MFLDIVKILLPIVTALTLGVFCRVHNIIDDHAMSKIKSLLNEIIIPLMLFNVFLFADFSSKSLVYLFSIFFSMILAYLIGCLIQRFVKGEYKEYFPIFVVTWEGGTLGISLCSLLLGKIGMQHMAIFDFGGALFLFGYIVPLLRIKEGVKVSSKQIFKFVLSTRAFDGIILGVILGALGVGKYISSHDVYDVLYHGIFDIIISPSNFLIIFMVGYTININKKILGPVMLTSIARVLVLSVSTIFAYFFISIFHLMDRSILVVLLIAFSLPPTYSLSVFTSFRGNKNLQEYSSNVISFSTILTLVLFAIISVYFQM